MPEDLVEGATIYCMEGSSHFVLRLTLQPRELFSEPDEILFHSWLGILNSRLFDGKRCLRRGSRVWLALSAIGRFES